MKRRVVISGMGLITPLGMGLETNWQALCQGRSGIGKVTRFDASSFRSQIAGEVKDFDAADFMDVRLARRIDPFIQFALAAALMAVEDSQLKISPSNAERVGVIVGTGLGGLATMERNAQLLLAGEQHRISPFFLPGFIANMAPGQIAITLGAKGPNSCPVTACAAGTHGVGDAFKVIQHGEADVMIAGGTDAPVTPLVFAGLDAMRATSTRSDQPERASRPFDKDRDGFVVSEGAGILILEELNHALARGAKTYAEVVGYGFNNDAYHMTAPSPDGEGAARCMRIALNDAQLSPQEVDYINAHGTSTPLNDLSETLAVKEVFGEHSKKLCLSSNKSMVGHLCGAAGAVEAILSALTINRGIIPPTINYETPDPQCDLDYVANQARQAKVRIALSNSFGFAGHNGTVVLREFEE